MNKSSDWRKVKLGEVAEIMGGGTPKREVSEYWNGVIPWATPTDITKNKTNEIAQTTEYITENGLSQSSAKLVPAGSVLMTSRATIGFCAINTIPMTTNQGFSNFICGDSVHNKFLLYLLTSNRDKFEQLGSGSTFKEISKSALRSFEVNLPPLPEQRKIATILSSVDDAIEKTEAIIKQTETLKKGLMHQLLTKGIAHSSFKQTEIGEIPTKWEMRKVGDLVKFEGGSQPPRDTFEFEPREGNIRLIQIRDYKTDKYATYVPKELARKFCTKGDVMIGRYGPPIFQILRGIEGAYNVALIKAVPNEQFVTKNYLFYFLKQETLFRLIDGLSQRTSGQTGVDMDALKGFAFPLPPIAEQHRIVEILGNLDSKLSHETQYIKQLNVIKNSLMKVLLTGKVRVKIDKNTKVVV